MNKLSRKLYQKVTWTTVIVSVVIFAVFIAVAAPLAADYMDVLTEGAPSPDTSFNYTAQDLLQMADDYGAEGRQAYVTLRFTFDLAFPVIYLFFLAASATKLLSFLPEKSRFRCMNMLPFFAVAFDLLENIMTAIVIGNYPKEIMWAANIAPYATMIKWVFVVLSFGLVVVLGIYRILSYLIKKRA